MLHDLGDRLRAALRRGKIRKKLDFYADGLGVRRRILRHLTEDRFAKAWAFAAEGGRETWTKLPDVRWRAHTCVWAAKQALHLNGDFVECGVNTGLLSMTVCRYLDFEKLDRTFWLYDTYAGIPTEMLNGAERRAAEATNASFYKDCYDIARRNFAPFHNARLVRGTLPGTIGEAPARIAYLSIDLNNETFERQTMEVLWPRLVPGAVIVIDDYGFGGHEAQRTFWDYFAAEAGVMCLALPTGQGLLIKP